MTAPMILDGPIDGESFVAWVEQFLCPTLKPDDIVILDNLGSHKVKEVRSAIAATGATIRYLPPYSPDFNPIEKLFSKLKSLLRSSSEGNAMSKAPKDRPGARSAILGHLPPPQSYLNSPLLKFDL